MHTPYTIRLAHEEDQPAIKALIREAGINPLGIHWPRFLVAVDGAGTLIGCGQVKTHGDGSRELASLVVREDWRGRGVARALMEHFLTHEPGPLYLTCRTELGPLYEKFGFRSIDVGEMPPYFKRVYRFINAGKLVGLEELRILVMVSESQENRS